MIINLMPITKEQVAHVSGLAKLRLSPQELTDYSRELVKIVEYIDRLAAIDTEGIELCADASAMHRLTREDIMHPSLPADDALRNAPETEDNYFLVPRVM